MSSPEQTAIGEIKETRLTPATARFRGVAQQDGAEVGVHCFCECLQVSVEERPEGSNKRESSVPRGNVHPRHIYPNTGGPELGFPTGNGPVKTSLNKVTLLLPSKMAATVTTSHGANHEISFHIPTAQMETRGQRTVTGPGPTAGECYSWRRNLVSTTTQSEFLTRTVHPCSGHTDLDKTEETRKPTLSP